MTASSQALPRAPEDELTLFRLYVLRAVYALIGLAEGAVIAPSLFQHDPLARGVIPSLLAAMCALDLVGIRYPRKMLPMLVFELVWKWLWLICFGFAQWSSGQVPATFGEDFKAILVGAIVMPLVIPWGYVWRNYVKAPGERWR